MRHAFLKDSFGMFLVVCFLVGFWFWMGVGYHRIQEDENQRKCQQNELLMK